MSHSKRILWSASDPGGMNAIAPVITALIERGDDVIGVAAGPALSIASLLKFPVNDASKYSTQELKDEVETIRPNIFLAGTSAGYSLDKKIIRLLPKKTPSVYVLDFWSNYIMRFSNDGQNISFVPNAVCVMDEIARDEMLDAGFDANVIRVTGNPYFEHFTDGISLSSENPNEILFISQPIGESGMETYGFDEHVVIEHLTRAIKNLPERFTLRIRLHPKDDPKKYNDYISSRVLVSDANSLEEALSSAGLIIGMFSPVLIQAAAAGKKVLSYEPGLKGKDPLITNRNGITRRVCNDAELREALNDFALGKLQSDVVDTNKLWKRGATERIVQIIDEKS